ncbi:PIG-L family deacetylase [Albibacterium indicum]|uniref:PIG-L family deacetylase n=1 Tax=Albibacterium indicum TaxID=2292082 RepID=UPI00197DB5A5|nr:PIG-L family deacetylase [Pedobacter indicus]
MLKNLPRVLYLAAHPDDENTGLLSWLVNDQHIETAYLSLTRGDGGQNLIGSEQGAALGLIRTYELLEARKIDGAKQLFSTAIDFGYSKSSEDTFTQWNLDSITKDVVWIIRNFKPDLIITRFPPTSAAGHGQHSASATIAEAAFKAAADPNKYPEQLKATQPWQTKRLLWNTFRFGDNNTTDPSQFKVEVGQYDPLLGMGYGELAGVSRSKHQSQGAGTPSVAGVRSDYFSPVAGEPLQSSLFDGLTHSFADIDRADIDQAIDQLLDEYDFKQPSASLPSLLELRSKLKSLEDADLKKRKLALIDQIILSSSGFMGEMVSNQSSAIPGEILTFDLNLISRSQIPVTVQKIVLLTKEDNPQRQLPADSLVNFHFQLEIPKDTKPTEPYWLSTPQKSTSQYAVESAEQVGLPFQKPDLNAKILLTIGEQEFWVHVPFSYKKLDPIKGDVVEQLQITPPLNISFTQPIFFAKGDSTLDLTINIQNHKNKYTGDLILTQNTKEIGVLKDVTLFPNQDSVFTITLAKETLDELQPNEAIEATFHTSEHAFNKNQHIIKYDHIPTLQYFTPASTLVLNGNLTTTAKRIGYIQGAGDFIPTFLRLAGIDVTFLTEADLSNAENLKEYDAVITGIRAINVEERMARWMSVLNQYIFNGGTVIMQFNTLQDMSTTEIGPYPFTISRNRVAEENAKVTFLDPKHQLLNTPNKITEDDFDGWIQEMGPYFPSEWDSAYTPLFEMHDQGEEPRKGALLYASYGKGHFIYTPLSFFRQLPVGHSGASKLFFNLLSIGQDEK